MLGWIIKNLVHPPIEEEAPPEPGLIVISPPKIYTRGYEGYHNLNFKSSVDSVTQVKLMLSDPKGIFNFFHVCYMRTLEYPRYFYFYESVLNKFQEHHLWQAEDSYDFPAGTTKTIRLGDASHYGVQVKPNAPLGVHTLTWHVKYTTYSLAAYQVEEVRVPWKVTVYPIEEAIWEATVTEEALKAPILLYPEMK